MASKLRARAAAAWVGALPKVGVVALPRVPPRASVGAPTRLCKQGQTPGVAPPRTAPRKRLPRKQTILIASATAVAQAWGRATTCSPT